MKSINSGLSSEQLCIRTCAGQWPRSRHGRGSGQSQSRAPAGRQTQGSSGSTYRTSQLYVVRHETRGISGTSRKSRKLDNLGAFMNKIVKPLEFLDIYMAKYNLN